MLRIIPEKEFYWCFSHWTLCVVVTWRALVALLSNCSRRAKPEV